MGFYNYRVHWGFRHDGGTDSSFIAASTVGRFSIGVIAAYDAYGPMVEVVGAQSWIGVTLVVKWRNLVGCGLSLVPRAWIADI